MDIDISGGLALGAVIFGAGGAYSLIKNVQSKLAEADRSRQSQGGRLGEIKARLDVMEGVLIGRGLMAPNADIRKRSRTVGSGVPLIPADSGESSDGNE